MKDLYSYIKPKKQIIDAHSHLFDHTGLLSKLYSVPKWVNKIVGFADICFNSIDKYTEGKIVDLYDNFIEKHYDYKKHILLATADNSYDAIEIYKKHPNVIKGFGEFKCYKVYRGEHVKYGNLNWLRPVCEFDKELRKPIYIHWCFVNKDDVKEFERLISDYPSIPFVLCHCGMGYDKTVDGDSNFAYRECVKLKAKYSNLYFDISYKALEYFTANPQYLVELIDKSVSGTDLNPYAFEIIKNPVKHKDDIYKMFFDLYRGEFENNINTLFSIGTYSNTNLTNYDYIVSTYLNNIEELPKDKQQHILTRINLISPMYIDNHIHNVISDRDKIIELYKQKRYRDIIDNYVINPYITTNDPEMNKVGDWLKDIKDETLLKLLSIGIYADKTSIIKRNGFDDTLIKLDVKSIMKELISNTELKTKEGTLYINCAGYLWNLYHDDITDWRRVRISVIEGERDLRNIYGISHILLQASNFYTQKITDEYKKEIDIVLDILKRNRLNGFKDLSIDLLCELALCIKYYNKNEKEYLYAKSYIEKQIKNKEILLSTKSTGNLISDLINNEHTNALYILLSKNNRFIK